MVVKKYKPTTPGRRKSSVLKSTELAKKRPEKSLTAVLNKKAGRNNTGRITVRHRGGGAKRLYRIVDFQRKRFDVPAVVEAIEYDPNRNAFIALIRYEDSKKSYILAGHGMKIGDAVLSSQNQIEAITGNRMPLEKIPVGQTVYNIELQPGKGGSIVRSAGTSAKLQVVEGELAQMKLPSGEIRLVPKVCLATIGTVSNSDYNLIRWGKAGRRRHLGWRPTVRGKAMNPVDHPHGGGEGRNPIGLKGGPKTPWGKKALGVKTRKTGKLESDRLIIRRRTKKRK